MESKLPGWERRGGLPPTHQIVVLVAETLADHQRPRWWRRRRSPFDFIPISREVVATLFLLPEGQRLVADALASDEAEELEAWRRIRAAWLEYCERGPSVFDWDYASRDLMRELTGQHVTYWYGVADDA